MAYQKQTWRDYDDNKTEVVNMNQGAVVTPERLNHMETGIANSADKAEVTAQLQQTEQELSSQLAQTVKPYKFEYPSTFSIPDEFKINLIRRGYDYITDFDIRTKKINNGGKTYYVAPDGSDTNDGLTSSTPFKKISFALGKLDVETIVMLDGVYFINEHSDGVLTINKSINWIGIGNPVLVLGNKYTWVKTPEHLNVYEISRTTINQVLDLRYKDDDGDYIKLTAVNSITEVDNTPHSYYFSGSKVYVRSYDDEIPTMDFMVYLQPQALSVFITDSVNLNQVKVYMENIEIIGADSPVVATTQPTQTEDNYLYALNCKFGYSYSGNNLTALGGRYFFVDCIATYANLDGFNYHINGTTKIPHALEINCIGRNNGHNVGDRANNGSTQHDGGKIIRVNGKYYNNQGGNVADINPGTQSINLNCKAYASRSDDPEYNANFTAHLDSEMWVYDSISSKSNSDFRVERDAKIYSKNNALFVGANEIPYYSTGELGIVITE